MRMLGIDACLVPSSRAEMYQNIGRDAQTNKLVQLITWGNPYPVIEVKGSPIAWVYFVSASSADTIDTTAHFSIPDGRLASTLSSSLTAECVALRHVPIFGKATGLRWQGWDGGLGFIDALQEADTVEAEVLQAFRNPSFHLGGYPSLGGYWDLYIAQFHTFSARQWKALEGIARCITTV